MKGDKLIRTMIGGLLGGLAALAIAFAWQEDGIRIAITLLAACVFIIIGALAF